MADARVVIRHVSLREDRYRDPASCVHGIRERIELGWHIVEIHGTDRGPLTVTYAISTQPGERRREDERG